MATINNKNLSILKMLVEAGFKDEKQITSIGMAEAVRLPRACRLDLESVLDCIQAVKAGKLMSYLVDDPETQEVVTHGDGT